MNSNVLFNHSKKKNSVLNSEQAINNNNYDVNSFKQQRRKSTFKKHFTHDNTIKYSFVSQQDHYEGQENFNSSDISEDEVGDVQNKIQELPSPNKINKQLSKVQELVSLSDESIDFTDKVEESKVKRMKSKDWNQ